MILKVEEIQIREWEYREIHFGCISCINQAYMDGSEWPIGFKSQMEIRWMKLSLVEWGQTRMGDVLEAWQRNSPHPLWGRDVKLGVRAWLWRELLKWRRILDF